MIKILISIRICHLLLMYSSCGLSSRNPCYFQVGDFFYDLCTSHQIIIQREIERDLD